MDIIKLGSSHVWGRQPDAILFAQFRFDLELFERKNRRIDTRLGYISFKLLNYRLKEGFLYEFNLRENNT
jgi:hypothetical protein